MFWDLELILDDFRVVSVGGFDLCSMFAARFKNFWVRFIFSCCCIDSPNLGKNWTC